MRSRADEIRKRIAKKKRERQRTTKILKNKFLLEDEERYGFDRMPSYELGPGEGDHPLFRKEVFLFKILASACLVLIIAILFKNQAPLTEPVRNFVNSSMERDFQFAAVSKWYEDQFGKPLALLPFSKEQEERTVDGSKHYALPVGKILEDFGENGQRITIETGKGAFVESMNEGFVMFAGKKEGFGNTVIIQHNDKSESWYGNLDDIEVNLYQYIKAGTKVGTATDSDDGMKGSFYFAVKKGDDFVDPSQVIQIE